MAPATAEPILRPENGNGEPEVPVRSSCPVNEVGLGAQPPAIAEAGRHLSGSQALKRCVVSHSHDYRRSSGGGSSRRRTPRSRFAGSSPSSPGGGEDAFGWSEADDFGEDGVAKGMPIRLASQCDQGASRCESARRPTWFGTFGCGSPTSGKISSSELWVQ